jgi:hypothetical protein
MQPLDIPNIMAAGSGIKGAGLLIESFCNNIVSTSPSSAEFQQKKQEIENTFDKINDFRDQIKSLLG